MGALLCYAIFQWVLMYKREPYKISGFLGNAPSLGNSALFRPNIPEWVLNHHLKGEKIYNSYGIGGYLLWHWYGQKKVALDGRSIIYDKQYIYDSLVGSGIPYNRKNDIKFAVLHISEFHLYRPYFDAGWLPQNIDIAMCLFKDVNGEESIPFIPRFHMGLDELKSYDRQHHHLIAGVTCQTGFEMLKKGWASSLKVWKERYPKHFKSFATEPVLTENYKMLNAVLLYLEENQQMENETVVADFFNHYTKASSDLDRGYALKSLLYYSGKLKPKLEELIWLEEKQPNNRQVLYTLAYFYHNQKNYDLAITKYTKLVKLWPDHAELYYQLASCYLEKGDLKESLEFIGRCLQLTENPEHAWIMKSIILYQSKRYRDAMIVVDKILEVKPKHPQSLRMKAMLKEHLK